MSKKVILRDSPEAASIQTDTGWVSSTGHVWGGDEKTARFDGATHQGCEKNSDHQIYEIRSYCATCRVEHDAAKFAAMPRAVWDEETPLVVFNTDTYFFDVESLIEYLEDNQIAPADTQLVICKPNMPRESKLATFSQMTSQKMAT